MDCTYTCTWHFVWTYNGQSASPLCRRLFVLLLQDEPRPKPQAMQVDPPRYMYLIQIAVYHPFALCSTLFLHPCTCVHVRFEHEHLQYCALYMHVHSCSCRRVLLILLYTMFSPSSLSHVRVCITSRGFLQGLEGGLCVV